MTLSPPGPLPRDLVDKTGRRFRVRAYTPKDRGPLEEMYRAFDPKRGAQGLPPGDGESIRRWLDLVLRHGQHVLVEIEGEILGHLMVIPMSADTSELANFLHQAIRNCGIGTALNRIALELARRDGRRRMWLSVEPSNRIAIRSYEKAGFRRTSASLWAPELEMEVLLHAEPAAGPDREPPGPPHSSGPDREPPGPPPSAGADPAPAGSPPSLSPG
ncbi:MAG TPA: GNAT family N-acetyltransferase [Longimicrobiales bacterium]|nr:GNAT family N-acetyltransferase [Longimicrobiales bacterium]